MSPDIIEQVRGFILDPVETFRNARGDELGEAIKYYAVILAIYAGLTGLMTMGGFGVYLDTSGFLDTFGSVGIGTAIGVILATFVGEIIGLLVVTLIIHVLVALFIGGNGIEATAKALAYASTPSMLFGWIPFIGPLAFVWTVILSVIGIREFHETTTGRAAVAVVLPVVALAVLFVLVIAAIAAVVIAANVAA
ncbi:hypothetical protein J2129_001671 [Methanofollis sp. W23]|uniref:YIP1 family protein n=1 Tax=Methanofollis sp. W23 TaxID=2817849 RepID=UPI001AE44EB9|nr:YIP1 family protein [Methanofollis sp. W23]MBP2146217.1 hypothetical protein [Methanofollis sp. W23]